MFIIWRLGKNISCAEFNFWKKLLQRSWSLESVVVQKNNKMFNRITHKTITQRHYITLLFSHSQGEFVLQKKANTICENVENLLWREFIVGRERVNLGKKICKICHPWLKKSREENSRRRKTRLSQHTCTMVGPDTTIIRINSG